LSHVHCQHSQLLPHLLIHFMWYAKLFKSCNDHLCWDLLPWYWSTETIVLHWASLFSAWCHNILPYQEPLRIKFLKKSLNGVFCRMCNYEAMDCVTSQWLDTEFWLVIGFIELL
jgi:hypothetical protein